MKFTYLFMPKVITFRLFSMPITNNFFWSGWGTCPCISTPVYSQQTHTTIITANYQNSQRRPAAHSREKCRIATCRLKRPIRQSCANRRSDREFRTPEHAPFRNRRQTNHFHHLSMNDPIEIGVGQDQSPCEERQRGFETLKI